MTKILVVDDESDQRLRICKVLHNVGYDVLEAEDGHQALQVLDDQMVQILITDWSMPRMDGLELCRERARRQAPGYIYIIFLTAHRDMSKLVDGLSAGGDDYLMKPVHPAELSIRVQAGERTVGLIAKDLTIFSLAKLAESRDVETGKHLERVQNYSKILATHLQKKKVFKEIDASFVQLIYETSPLHDIGKVSVPDSILQKRGKLTPEEFEVMKRHAQDGENTLTSALDRHPAAMFLRMAAEIAGAHHEKYDGNGYPNGLVGEEIPLAGRIVALVDVYDALTSKRCYKEAMTHEEARAIIMEGAGTHFDPRIVEVFLEIQDDFIRTRQEFR